MTTEIKTDAAVSALIAESRLRYGEKVTLTMYPNFNRGLLTVRDNVNYRLAKGATVAGVVVTTDQRNFAGMAHEIRTLGGINTPLVASEREDGSTWLLQGFRRFGGSQIIIDTDPGSPLALQLATLPVIVYRGLTLEQEKDLVNDQKSKQFTLTETFLYFEEQINGGHDWRMVAGKMYHQIAAALGSAEEVRRIDNLTDPTERDAELTKWLQTTCQQFWANAIKDSPITRELTVRTFMYRDGHIPTRPDVLMDSGRMRKLHSAYRDDVKAQEWNQQTGRGPRFDKMLKDYADADAKKYAPADPTAPPADPVPPKVRSNEDYYSLIADQQRIRKSPGGLVEQILRVGLKGGGNPEALRFAHNADRCRQAYNQHRAYLKPDVSAVFDLIFAGGDGSEDKFTEFLTANYAAEQTAEPFPPVVQEVPAVVQELPPAPEVQPEAVPTPEVPAVVPEVQTPDPAAPVTQDEAEKLAGDTEKHGKKRKKQTA